MELTREALEEVLVADDLDGYRAVVESLSDELDLMRSPWRRSPGPRGHRGRRR